VQESGGANISADANTNTNTNGPLVKLDGIVLVAHPDLIIKREKMFVTLVFGVLVGVIMALTGAGGGILAVPLLVFGAHMQLAQAGPVGLLAVGLAAALGASIGLRAGIVRYKAALLVSVSGILVSPVGMWLAQRLPNRPLTLVFAVVLMWVAYRSYRQGQRGVVTETAPSASDSARVSGPPPPPCILDPVTGRFVWTWACARALLAAGVAAGFLSGLLGVGGGFVMVPALQRCTNLTIQSIVATSLAVIALVSASGVLVSALAGHLDWVVGMPFSGGALLGMLGGRWLSGYLSAAHLSKAFAVLSLLVALGLAGKALF
jgi:hypothetical protein